MIRLDAIQSAFPDETKVLSALKADGKQRFERLTQITRSHAKPSHFPASDVAYTREGAFAAAYA